jgi:hypothetical protein
MGSSIGELFVELGFEFNDKKLQEFNGLVKSAGEGLLGLAGISSLSFGGVLFGMERLVSGAGRTALSLRDLTSEYGVGAESAQRYAAAMTQVNTKLDLEGAFSSIKAGSDYLTAIRRGTGNAFALNMLGAESVPGMKFDELVERMRKAVRENPYHLAAADQAMYVKQILGTADAMNILTKSTEDYNKIAEHNIGITKQAEENLIRYEADKKALGVDFDKYMIPNVYDPLAVGADRLIKTAQEQGFWSATKLFAKGFWDQKINMYKWIGGQMKDGLQSIQDEADDIKREKNGLPPLHRDTPSTTSGATRGLRNNNPGNIEYGPFAKSHGATGTDGRFAIFPDSATGVSAIASLLKVYDKQHLGTISEIINKYTKGDSPETQAAYKAVLSRFTGAGINDQLNMSNPALIEKLVRGIVYQENAGKAGNLTLTQNIHSSSADALDIADHSMRMQKAAFDKAYVAQGGEVNY